MKKILLLSLIIGLVGCSKPTPTQMMSRDFNSMDDCISSIQRSSGYKLDIVTDKLGDISGFLGDTRLGFQCKTESSGTKGVYVRGWYEVEE